jgi:hypothetical protein
VPKVGLGDETLVVAEEHLVLPTDLPTDRLTGDHTAPAWVGAQPDLLARQEGWRFSWS